ncbi:MAG: acyl-CoA dehydrogenase N-terminal domain-containing protein [Proteobacteria bacterium]|nr:acyl-CoA dehydrogenase N-terminal domain-containing protein [Pseudomonadota bacterium]
MSNLLVNARDQVFLLFEQLGIEKLFQTEIFKDFSKDDALMMMNEAEKMALNVILPTYTAGDKEGCTFKDGKVTVPKCYHEAFKKYVEGGWLSPVQPIEVGGQGGCRSSWPRPTWNPVMPPISPSWRIRV